MYLRLKVFIALAINKRLCKTFFPERVFTNAFISFAHFFCNPCQAPFLRIYQEVLHRQIFSEKVKNRYVGSSFSYLEPKVLKLQEERGRTSF